MRVVSDTHVTAAEAANRLGVSIRTIHRLVARGDLAPARKLPGATGAYLFDADDVTAAAIKLGKAAA